MVEVFYIILTIVGYAISGITLVFTTIKKKKLNAITDEQEKAEEEARITRGRIQIVESIPTYIKNAETMLNGEKTGLAKFNLVIQWVQIQCLMNNIPYDEAYFTNIIEDILGTPTKKGA